MPDGFSGKGPNNYQNNVLGYPPTDTYKVSISYLSGYKASSQLTISAPNAYKKAKKTAHIIWNRLKRLGISFDNTNTEYLGFLIDKEPFNKKQILKIKEGSCQS